MNRTRLRTLEAMTFLALARLLIRFVPFARWSRWLGESGPVPTSPASENAADPGTASLPATVRACVAAVRRASWRLPASLCLPQAMALQWMLARRGADSAVIIGFLPLGARNSPDALHAWVELGGVTILGDSGGAHASLLQFRKKS
ncbi:lasso peptide biosynthesis B2 protein [Croceicoccus sp. BE223]|uniref:lasso peptide biosynthesis B2 protein n=1 Tax=Croceicoccus sp. BE223 TaxID=2817716 RepID=UPI002865E33A|nr:lasso peptide biosynthesis B2 protein [Croceicoccus sp. BE223]MDR7100880.1 hypothetical protein [Croceicoccus sp. BE223]